MKASTRTRTFASLALAGTMFLTACASTKVGIEDSTTFRTVGTLPIESYGTEALDLLKESVEESTSGTVELENYPAGQLYSDADAVEAIPSGAADAGIVQLDTWSGLVPEVGVLYIPFLYDDSEHFYKARADMSATLDEALQEKANTKLLGWFNYSAVTTMSLEPIESSADFPGHRLRAFGEYSSRFIDLVGADAMVMSSSDVYDGIQRGTIDGAISAWSSFVDRSLYEVGDYVIEAEQLPVTTFAVVMNLDAWEQLSQTQQEALVDGGQDVHEWSAEAMVTSDANDRATLQENGVELTAWDEATFTETQEQVLPDLRDAYIEKSGDVGKALIEMIEDAK